MALAKRVVYFSNLAAGTGVEQRAAQITNDVVTVQAVRANGGYAGFDVLGRGKTAAVVRLGPDGLIVARRCRSEGGRTLVFEALKARDGCGLRLGAGDRIVVALEPGSGYPVVSFDLTVAGFDAARWQAAVGKQPFHFLALVLPDAEVWHQRGWLNATPLADPFPLLQDVHIGSPEISATYNRNWSNTPPLGANPLPIIGLWAPQHRHYVGFEFQTTRLEDNSEKDVATGYRWQGGAHPEQFVALVYPYGGPGYQQLVFPKGGERIASHGRLLWSLDLASTDDPNAFFFADLWKREQALLPRVPAGVDLSWLPGGIRLRDFEGPPQGSLIAGVEGNFQVPGTRLIDGWRWENEFPTQVAKAQGDTRRLQELEREAETLLPYTKRFTVGGDECAYWEKPFVGAWTPEWGGSGVTTLHNANGFAAGRLFLGLYRDLGKTEYLPIVDGVFHWAKHIVWTRNEFADVPSSPFAIGGTLSASFCLDYYHTFRNAPDAAHRQAAQQALELARTFTYRYMVLWPSDNDRDDNLDSTFLWEPNSGRDWTGAACCNEVCFNLDTLAQTAVATGDPILMWALQGALDRWHLLYQNKSRDSLADYQGSDMTEGYGLYAGNIYGLGDRAPYGFAFPLAMLEPVGDSTVRVLAGEGAAMVFNKEGVRTGIRGYRYTAPGNLAFTIRSLRPHSDLSLTVPYVDMSHRPVTILRESRRTALEPGRDFVRPPQALWSLTIKDVQPDDRIVVGAPDETGPVLPTLPPLTQGQAGLYTPPTPAYAQIVPLLYDAFPDMNWAHLDSWAGLPRGPRWAFGIPFALPPNGGRSVVAKPVTLAKPLTGANAIALLYGEGDGSPPAVIFSDGTLQSVEETQAALAWRNWPPIYTQRLLVAPVSVGGKTVVGIDPGGRVVWALTALRGGSDETARVLKKLQVGAADWQRVREQERVLAELKQEMARIPAGSVAILPPDPSGPAANLLEQVGLAQRQVMLTPAQLVDPATFNARKFPVAIYADGEDYLHTVSTPGDAAEASIRYVQEGGTLILLPSQPWPLYYATGPGFHRMEPLTDRLGLPLGMAIETAPGEKLTVQSAPDQSVLSGVPAAFPYPPGDPRLRSIDKSRLLQGARYVPIYTVRGASGKVYGDAAGLIQFPEGHGRILYIAAVLLRDKEHGPAIAQAALRYLLSGPFHF